MRAFADWCADHQFGKAKAPARTITAEFSLGRPERAVDCSREHGLLDLFHLRGLAVESFVAAGAESNQVFEAVMAELASPLDVMNL